MRRKDSTFPSVRNGLHAAALVAALVCSAGCVSFHLGSYGTPSRLKGASKTEVVQSDSNGIDEIIPVVERPASHRAKVTFDLIGDFKVEESVDIWTTYPQMERLAFGFFPGAACDDTGGRKAGSALLALWYNIILAGTPTLSGLLIEPFVPAGAGPGSRFSRSALFGFHRWGVPSRTEVDREKSVHDANRVQLKAFSCDVTSPGTASVASDTLNIYNLEPDAKTVTVMLRLPQQHPLKKQMSDFEGVSLEVGLDKEE